MKNESIATSYCINIPEGATNGDVIKAMFPQIEYKTRTDGVLVDVYDLDSSNRDDKLTFYADWWNAPYKTESEDICG